MAFRISVAGGVLRGRWRRGVLEVGEDLQRTLHRLGRIVRPAPATRLAPSLGGLHFPATTGKYWKIEIMEISLLIFFVKFP